MPYKSSKINWSLLVGPTMQGLSTEAQANSDFARSIMGGLDSLGSGIADQRREKESNRRARVSEGLQGRALDMRDQENNRAYDLRARNQLADDAQGSYLADQMGELLGAAESEQAQFGEVTPETDAAVTRLAQASPQRSSPRAKTAAESSSPPAAIAAPSGDLFLFDWC